VNPKLAAKVLAPSFIYMMGRRVLPSSEREDEGFGHG